MNDIANISRIIIHSLLFTLYFFSITNSGLHKDPQCVVLENSTIEVRPRPKNICFSVLQHSCKCTCIFHSLCTSAPDLALTSLGRSIKNVDLLLYAFSWRAGRRKKRITFLSIFQKPSSNVYQLTSPKSVRPSKAPKRSPLKTRPKFSCCPSAFDGFHYPFCLSSAFMSSTQGYDPLSEGLDKLHHPGFLLENLHFCTNLKLEFFFASISLETLSIFQTKPGKFKVPIQVIFFQRI